jgi:putative flippase GtrA
VIAKIKLLSQHTVVRYAFAGGSALVTEEIGLWLFHGRLHWALWLATTIAFGSAFAVNFLLNRMLTFAGDGARDGAMHTQTLKFSILVGINYFVTLGIMSGLTHLGVNYLIAKPMATAFITLYNFYVYKKWVFKSSAPKADALEGPASDASDSANRIRA